MQAPVLPFYRASDYVGSGAGTLWDYLGLPLMTANDVVADVSALPFRAYNLIFNEYYRDQNLYDPVDVLKTSGQQTDYDTWTILLRAWEKDYLTSALPFAQRGEPVSIPNSVTYLDESEIYELDGTGAGDR